MLNLLTAARVMAETAMGARAQPLELDAQTQDRLLQAQLDRIYAHVTKAAFISTIFALALVVYLTPVFGAAAAHTWFVLKAVVAAGRFGLAQAYQRSNLRSNLPLANALVVGSLAIDGAVWGLAGVWGIHEKSEVVSLLVACLASVAMLGTFGLQVRQQATAAYVLPMLLPLSVALASRGEALGLLGASGALLVLAQMLVTGFASERRLKLEFASHRRTEEALLERSTALQEASAAKAQLELALQQSSRTSVELRDALEQVKRQSAVKAMFLSKMSHELRTPLHGILGLTDLVHRHVTDPAARHHIDLIRASGAHLLDVIGSLLDVSRLDSGRLELQAAPFDLALECRNMAELYELRCQSKGLGFQALLEIPAPCWVRGDAARVRQVLHNLLGNAVKFTDHGLLRFRVRQRDGGYSFDVADTGPGIAASEIPHIFDAFTQVGEAVFAPSDGTGLGLTIARELAQVMGGNIRVSSVEGVGSRFVFTALLEALPADEIPDDARRAYRVQTMPAQLRVLLVEDNDVNALIADSQLQSLGIYAQRVRDGLEAVNAALAEPRPDLVLMDCQMPVMNGLAASREIRAREAAGDLRNVPIVAVTAMTSADECRECCEAGMTGFLSKPFTVEQLRQSIEQVTRHAAAERMNDHPLYEFALTLGDMEPDVFGGVTMH